MLTLNCQTNWQCWRPNCATRPSDWRRGILRPKDEPSSRSAMASAGGGSRGMPPFSWWRSGWLPGDRSFRVVGYGRTPRRLPAVPRYTTALRQQRLPRRRSPSHYRQPALLHLPW